MKNYPVICWFSAGITSAVATWYALRENDNCRVIFIKTGQEQADSFRFLKECEKHFDHEIEIYRSPKYSSAFDVWERTKYLNGVGGARCTLELKKKVRYWLEDEIVEWKAQVFGFDANEQKRALRFSEQNPKAKGLYPLIDHLLTKEECAGIVKSWGIELPLMYRLGFPNNNCIGCVKGGKGYWNRVRDVFPETFERMAKLERQLNHSCINGTFLDELPKDCGKLPVLVPSCGLYCNPEFL